MGLGETLGMYLAVTEENSRKNLVFAAALNFAKAQAEASFSWSFDKDRVLHISITGLTLAGKTAIQIFCDTQFGPGKVVVS